jgi:hypothetical protein
VLQTGSPVAPTLSVVDWRKTVPRALPLVLREACG